MSTPDGEDHPLLTRPVARLIALSSIARAAGGAGNKAIFAQAWVDTWQMIDTRPTLECVTSSLLRLAYGSAYLADWERVELAARLALDLATERNEETVRQEAQRLLDSVTERQLIEELIAPPQDQAIIEAADALAAELVRKLAVRAGGRDHPRVQC